MNKKDNHKRFKLGKEERETTKGNICDETDNTRNAGY